MPQRETATRVKQYKVVMASGDKPVGICPTNLQRNFLAIENVGASNAKFWFDEDKDSGQAIVLPPGAFRQYDHTCPVTSLYIQQASAAQATLVVIEGLVQNV